ncbi:hypothetical protein EV200_10440 [Pedobacter psychrotolerans]|uniref:YXWGXW repeat-containing protein n=1 Tax=Pedobacter psychrotolerans TaxID=1843235 RepID=A0A4V2RZB0_9SPHI|nr:hypothetical protein [Pedobacter psychrotolerans]TCO25005.1 hypothetical protein EV200_10440 [Pedobacter psychrotolerans]GGE48836.1 hypothetical protein GCM10011413_13680 [Pedobacter psychrotolerans]
MKKLLIISAIVGIVALTSNQSSAQVSLNVNIGSQPTWVPAGYQDVNYYYLPEVNSYYYVPQRQFVYLNGNRWTRSRSLPNRYRGYDLNNGRKVVVYGNQPYRSYHKHQVKYANRSNVYRSAYGGGNRVNYRPVRNNHRSFKVDKGRHGRHENPRFAPHGHGGKHGRH